MVNVMIFNSLNIVIFVLNIFIHKKIDFGKPIFWKIDRIRSKIRTWPGTPEPPILYIIFYKNSPNRN